MRYGQFYPVIQYPMAFLICSRLQILKHTSSATLVLILEGGWLRDLYDCLVKNL